MHILPGEMSGKSLVKTTGGKPSGASKTNGLRGVLEKPRDHEAFFKVFLNGFGWVQINRKHG